LSIPSRNVTTTTATGVYRILRSTTTIATKTSNLPRNTRSVVVSREREPTSSIIVGLESREGLL